MTELKQSKKKGPLIAWEKWKDPYGDNQDETEFPGFDLPEEKPEYDDGYGDLEQAQINEQVQYLKKRPAIMLTQLGPIPLVEQGTPSKVFNFWMAHTNFHITKIISKIIENTDGVEVFNVFSPYRFRIGVGKVFVPRTVMNEINTNILGYFRALEMLKETLKNKPKTNYFDTAQSNDNSQA